jgi:hypothetical protein
LLPLLRVELARVLPEASFRRRKAAASCRTPKATGAAQGEARKNSSKLPERCANIIESKGPLLNSCRQSGNVYEKTGS